jgi:hypothetical protein
MDAFYRRGMERSSEGANAALFFHPFRALSLLGQAFPFPLKVDQQDPLARL